MQSTLAVISLETIVRNALLVQQRAGVPLVAVLKDDAYGHGAERVASALAPHVSAFAVATAEEGAALRTAGIAGEILLLTPCLDMEDALRAMAYSLQPAVTSFPALRLLPAPARIQLAVNTGMNRYGFRPEEIERACREAKERGHTVTGVFSHFYAPENAAAREEQYALFVRASERVSEQFPSAVRHLSATGGILAGPKYNFDCVRSGIALYGYLPAGFEGTLPVKPAMRIYARCAQSGAFIGGGIGYAAAEREYGSVHTLRVGYGDGFFRAGGLGNEGNLCMDACVREGKLPFGRMTPVLTDAAEYAAKHNTTAYEALVNVAKKAVKRYV